MSSLIKFLNTNILLHNDDDDDIKMIVNIKD
jgi:hypothetical protein